MKNKILVFVALALAATLVVGAFNPVSADSPDEDRKENFREILGIADGAIRGLRLKGDNAAKTALFRLENRFDSFFRGTSNPLKGEIKGDLSNLKTSSDLESGDIRELKSKIEKLGAQEGLSLSFIYEYAVLVILSVSFTLALVVAIIQRTFVDWEEVNRVKQKQSDLQDKLNEAKQENDKKKVHKIQEEQREFMQEHMGTMFSPMKTMLIIIIPFFIVFSVMRSTYGGWVVAWLPFTLPWPNIGLPLLSRFFKGTVASLGFFGWYILAYFGLSQIWRKILVPSS